MDTPEVDAVQAVAEREMADGVQARKRELLELLPEGDRDTTSVRGSSPAITFEDKAKARAKWHRDHCPDSKVTHELADLIEQRLAAFQAAVNVYWSWAVSHGLPTALAAEWRKKHRKQGQHISKEEVEAEVIFILRHFIIRFAPTNEERLFSYAYRGVLQHLTEWSAQQGPIELPQKAAREVSLRDMRAGGSDAGERAYNPYDAIDAYLDGEIDARDL